MATLKITPLYPSLGAEVARSQNRLLWRIIVEGDRPRL